MKNSNAPSPEWRNITNKLILTICTYFTQLIKKYPYKIVNMVMDNPNSDYKLPIKKRLAS